MPDISKVRLDEVEYFIKDKAFRDSVGNLNELLTNKKDNLVNAINEIATTDESHAVKYTSQDLDSDQMKQARDNIGVGSVVADTLIDLKLVTPLYDDDGGAISTADGTILALGGDEPPFIKTINGVGPDEDGNVNIESAGASGCVTSVNGMTGDVVIEVNPGSGGVSSWNDLTDRPFYEEISEVELYRNENLAFEETETEGTYLSQMVEGFIFEDGKTYRINWDGSEYVCDCMLITSNHLYSMMYMGNLGITDSSHEDSGEPFLMEIVHYIEQNVGGFIIGTTSTLSTHSVVISGEASVVTALDEKFVPDSVARKSDVTWENLPDKPFGEESDGAVIEWDGNTEGRVSVGNMYHVSDLTPSAEDLIGVRIAVNIDGEIQESTLNDDAVSDLGDVISLGIGYAIIVKIDGAVDGDTTFPKAGVYFARLDDNTGYNFEDYMFVSSLSYVGSVTVKQLDEKYIPDTIARTADIPTDDHINELIAVKLAETTLPSAEEASF